MVGSSVGWSCEAQWRWSHGVELICSPIIDTDLDSLHQDRLLGVTEVNRTIKHQIKQEKKEL